MRLGPEHSESEGHASVRTGPNEVERSRTQTWRTLRTWAVRLAGLAVVVYFAFFLFDRREKITGVLDIGLWEIAVLCAAILAGRLVQALLQRALYRGLSIRVSLISLLLISSMSNLLNYLPLRFGTLTKANLLKRLFRLRYARFLVAYVMQHALVLFAAGLVGVPLVVARFSPAPAERVTLLIGFGICLAVPIVALCLRGIRFSDRHYIGRVLNDFSEGWDIVRKQPAKLGAVVGLMTVTIVLNALRIVVAFQCVGIRIGWDAGLVLGAALALSPYLGFVPGSLGLREGLIGLCAGLLGLPVELAVFAVTIDRAVMLVLAILLGAPSCVWAWVRVRSGASRSLTKSGYSQHTA